jgi:hypothetical protein
VEAKLGDEIIIGKIKSSPGNFDTSIDAILKLKAAGASDAVIHAMVDARPTAKAVVKEASLAGGAFGVVKVELKTPVRLMVDEPLSIAVECPCFEAVLFSPPRKGASNET